MTLPPSLKKRIGCLPQDAFKKVSDQERGRLVPVKLRLADKTRDETVPAPSGNAPRALPRTICCIFPEDSYPGNVQWLNKAVAVVLLVLWVPATSLCLVERAGFVSNDDCCPSSSDKAPGRSPPDGSPCCALASGKYRVNEERPVAMVALAVAFVALLNMAELSAAPYLADSCSAPPPELPATWQFSLRTALAPRAPSLAS